ncbi:MAG: RecT family recombinase [Phycicoccus sp.]
MSTELTVGPSSGALALRADQHQWTDQQRAALTQIGVDKAGAGDLAVFMHVAQRTGLDPFSRQLYMIERGGKHTIQTGIDGFRVIASRRPEYAGQSEPQWCGDDEVWRDIWASDKPPVAARVRVHRHDWTEPAAGVAHFAEFTAGNSMWRSKPAHMIAKVAEALALRKAFPHDLSGLLTPEEAERDDRPTHVMRTPAQPAATVAELTGTVPPGGHMRPEQQKRLFALLRDTEIDDRWTWASGILGREVASYGQLTAADAETLIERLEIGLSAGATDGGQG